MLPDDDDPSPGIPDHLTKYGAERLARRIASYWARRGGTVKTSIVLEAEYKWLRKPIFAVRSDMINGRPAAS